MKGGRGRGREGKQMGKRGKEGKGEEREGRTFFRKVRNEQGAKEGGSPWGRG